MTSIVKNLVSHLFPASKIHPPCLSYFLLWILIATQGLYPVLAQAGTISGQIQTATGGVVTNGTLNFTLNQAAILPGTALIASSQTSCYTSNLGNVVGVPDPIVPPSLSTNLVSGTLPAGTYFVKITYVSGTGESQPSPEQTINLSAQGTLIVAPPVLQPPTATTFNTYISATSNTEQLQGTSTGFTSFSRSVPLGVGAIPPLANTSSCQVRFSDELIPSGTYYKVSLLNKNGSQISGFPQNWCLYGGPNGNDNVSQGAPTGLCNVIYPTPIVSVPIFNAPQNISGPLSLNNYLLSAGGAQFINPLSSSQPYHINFGIDNSGTGGYIFSSLPGNADISGGSAFNGVNWVAKHTTANAMILSVVGTSFTFDSGLTVGNTFTPTSRFGISPQGAVPTPMPFIPQGYLDFTNTGACTTTLSAPSHGIFCYDKNANAFKFSANGGAYTIVNGGGQGFYNTIELNGAALAQEPILNFISTHAIPCVDNAGLTRTDCPLFNTSTTIGSGAAFTLTSDAGYGGTGTNPFITLGGGTMIFNSGLPSNNNKGDDITIKAADSVGGNHGGAAITMSAGNATGTFPGGGLLFTAGIGGAGGGAIAGGGTITMNTGGAGSGNSNGGIFTISIGGKAGAGSNGFFQLGGNAGQPSPSLVAGNTFALAEDTNTQRMLINENGDTRGFFNATGQAEFSAFCSGLAAAASTIFLFNAGASAVPCTDTTSNLAIPVPSSGFLRNLTVHARVTPNTTDTITITDNGGNTALTCAITNPALVCSDVTHVVSVAAGDLLRIKIATTGATTAQDYSASFEKQ